MILKPVWLIWIRTSKTSGTVIQIFFALSEALDISSQYLLL